LKSLIKFKEPEGLIIGRIAKNTTFILLAKAIDIGFSIFATSIIARYLGINAFGEYMFVIALVSLVLSFSCSGLEIIVVRELAKNNEEASRIFGTVLFSRWILIGMVLPAIIVITIIVNVSFIIKLTIIIASISQITSSTCNIYITVFRAFEKMEYETLVTFIYRLIYLAAILTVILLNLGFTAIFIALFIASILRTFLTKGIVRAKFFRPKLILNIKAIKYFLNESIVLGFAVFTIFAVARIDVLLLKLFRGAEDVGIFNAAYALILQLQILSASFVGAIMPLLSRYGDSSPELFITTYKNALKFILFFSFPLVTLFFYFSNGIIHNLYGKGFEMATVALQILIFGCIFSFLNVLFDNILIAINKQVLVTFGQLSCLLVNLTLDLLLIPKYGYIGACVGTLAAYVVVAGIGFYFLHKNLGISGFDISVFRLIFAGAIMLLYLFISRNLGLFAAVLSSLLIYIIAVLLLKVFQKEEILVLKKGLRFR